MVVLLPIPGSPSGIQTPTPFSMNRPCLRSVGASVQAWVLDMEARRMDIGGETGEKAHWEGNRGRILGALMFWWKPSYNPSAWSQRAHAGG